MAIILVLVDIRICRVMVRVMVLNATFSNIPSILWRSVLLVEETGVPGKNHRPIASNWQTLSHNVVSSTPLHERDSNSQLYWWYVLIGQVVVNLTTTTAPFQYLYVSFARRNEIHVECDCFQIKYISGTFVGGGIRGYTGKLSGKTCKKWFRKNQSTLCLDLWEY